MVVPSSSTCSLPWSGPATTRSRYLRSTSNPLASSVSSCVWTSLTLNVCTATAPRPEPLGSRSPRNRHQHREPEQPAAQPDRQERLEGNLHRSCRNHGEVERRDPQDRGQTVNNVRLGLPVLEA